MSRYSQSDYAKGLLLEGRWLPTTRCVLFVNSDAQATAEILQYGSYGSTVTSKYGSPLVSRKVTGESLDDVLATLLPLTIPIARRYLVVPTANPAWSALFTSGWVGLDALSPMMWFSMSGVESVAVTDNPGPAGARKIQMYELTPSGERVGHSIGVQASDRRGWDVIEPSLPFPVGNIWDPTARRVQDRFTHDHIVEMTALFGLRPFDEDFYAPNGEGIIVEYTHPMDSDERTGTLGQARGEEPVDF